MTVEQLNPEASDVTVDNVCAREVCQPDSRVKKGKKEAVLENCLLLLSNSTGSCNILANAGQPNSFRTNGDLNMLNL